MQAAQSTGSTSHSDAPGVAAHGQRAPDRSPSSSMLITLDMFHSVFYHSVMLDPGGTQSPDHPHPATAEPRADLRGLSDALAALEFGGEPATITLLLGVPELAARYLILAEAADGDPGAPSTFEALADHVADLLRDVDNHQDQLRRAMAAVERVIEDTSETEDLVTWGFLDNLAPSERDLLRPWFGSRTAALADALDPPDTVP